MIKNILLRLYPAAFRKEYGEEFADVLASRPLTLGAVANVLWSSAGQRFRHAATWLLAGMCLLLLHVTRMLLQFIGMVSMQEDSGLDPMADLPLAQTGLWIAIKRNGSFLAGLTGTIEAALLFKIPMFVLPLLFSRTSIFTGAPVVINSRLEGVGFAVLFVAAAGAVFGHCGAICGTIIRRFRRHFA
jgi:hypothetical protein